MIRNIRTMSHPNDGTRSLEASIMAPEIILAFKDWSRSMGGDFVLIGGLALSFHASPRYTTDIDLLFLENEQIPADVPGFKRIRPHAFEHRATGVEVEVLTPASLKVRRLLVEMVIQRSLRVDGVKIASREGIIALKLCRGNLRDLGDIESLMEGQPAPDKVSFLSDWPLSAKERSTLSKALDTIYP